MMDPTNMYYCLFMLSCFGRLRLHDEQTCPPNCDCYYAPSDGIIGEDTESLICSNASLLTSTNAIKSMNTLVLRNDHFQRQEYSKQKKHSTISVVFEEFTTNSLNSTNSPQDTSSYIFHTFNEKTLKYLTFIKSEFLTQNKFDWTTLKAFVNLEAIYIETTPLPQLDSSFSSIISPSFHSLTIRSCLLAHIDREAFVNKWNVRKLVITDNQIRNWIWLTSTGKAFTKLWHLDLSINRLTYIPSDLKKHIPNLRVLYLAHNQFKYFLLQTLEPWFTIDEFMLAAIDQSNQKPDTILYADQDMKNIQTRINQLTSQKKIFPTYLESSLVNDIKYDCPKHSPNIVTWWNLNSCPSFDYFPDKLYMNSTGKLVYGMDPTVGNQLEIHGIDFIRNDDFSFDSTLNVKTYRENRQYLITQLESITSSSNSIRVQLFSKQMLQYFVGKIKITQSQIDLIIDLVVELLDEAGEKKMFVMLCMWNYADIEFGTEMTQLYNQKYTSNVHDFKDKLIKPLLERINRHPALIGIELISNFMSDASLTNSPTSMEACEGSNENNILNKIKFLGYNAKIVKQYSGHVLLGVGMAATCRSCLYYSLMESCRLAMGFTGQYGLDFVTFISHLSNVNAEPFGHTNWLTEKPAWFDTLTGELESDTKVGIFYVLHEENTSLLVDEAKSAIDKFASGYFVVDSTNAHYVPVTNRID